MSAGQGERRSFGTAQQPPERLIHPIRPVTIRQILDASSDVGSVLVVDGKELTQATVVGRIIEYESANMGAASGGIVTARHLGYRISDNTGSMIVRQWVEQESSVSPIPLGSHVRASGTVKTWQGSPVVTGITTAILDSNELNYHMLDAVLTHLRLIRGDKRVAGQAVGGAIRNTAGVIGIQNVLPAGENIPVTDLILDSIRKSSDGDSGLSIDEIIAYVKRFGVGGTEVRGALRVLVSEGQIYQTHDNRFNM